MLCFILADYVRRAIAGRVIMHYDFDRKGCFLHQKAAYGLCDESLVVISHTRNRNQRLNFSRPVLRGDFRGSRQWLELLSRRCGHLQSYFWLFALVSRPGRLLHAERMMSQMALIISTDTVWPVGSNKTRSATRSVCDRSNPAFGCKDRYGSIR